MAAKLSIRKATSSIKRTLFFFFLLKMTHCKRNLSCRGGNKIQTDTRKVYPARMSSINYVFAKLASLINCFEL